MTSDDEIRGMLRARADRMDVSGIARTAVASAHATPQLRQVGEKAGGGRGPRGRLSTPVRLAAAVGTLAAALAVVALLASIRTPPGSGGGSSVAPAPSSAPESAVPSPTQGPSTTPTDIPVTPPPYVAGSCPVTPVTDLAAGDAPEVVTSGISWWRGPIQWQAGVGQKVVLLGTTPDQIVVADEIIAERLGEWSPTIPAKAAYFPEGGGPGFVFGIGLPSPGCWLLTAVGPFARSSVVVEVGPAPANPPDPASQNVPVATATLRPPDTCWTSPLVPGAKVRTWLDGDTRWEDPADTIPWHPGDQRKLVVTGVVSADAAVNRVVAMPVGSVGPRLSQQAMLVADQPFVGPGGSGSGSKAFDVVVPTAGCWAIAYVTPTATSTIVVSVGR